MERLFKLPNLAQNDQALILLHDGDRNNDDGAGVEEDVEAEEV